MSAAPSPHPRPQSAATVARNRRKSLASAIAVVIIVLISGAVWLVAHRGGTSTTANAVSAPTSASKTTGAAKTTPAAKTTGAAKGVPARVAATLALIDAGRWPDAANAPGTQGGRSFRNGEGLLPRTDASGKAMRYQEWDVNAKLPGRGRDAERIITAADGSAWYTLDHYRTFIKIRGPSS